MMMRPLLGSVLLLTPCILSAMPSVLSEVVITASRRPQAFPAVAASLSKLSADELGRLDVSHANEALNRVAGVLMQHGSGQESLLAIRSPVLSGPGACGSFLVLEDGFPIRPTGFCNINELLEINTSQAAAIEVLRGPGNALHGAGAVHGVINVLTPDAATLAGHRADLTLGPHRFRTLRVAFGDASTVGDSASAVYGFWRHDDGFRVASPVSEGKLNLLHDTAVGDGALRLRLATTTLAQRTAGFLRGYDAYRDPKVRESNANPEAFRDAASRRLSIAWNRTTCGDCLDELRAIFRESEMRFLQHFLLGKPLESNAQNSVALALGRARPFSRDNSLTWRLGLDAEFSHSQLLEIQEGPTLEGSAAARAIRPAGRHYDYRVAAHTLAAYAELATQQGSRWQWRLALRTDQTQYRYDNRMRDGNTAEDGTICASTGCLYSRPEDRTDRFTNLTPRAELRFAASDTDQFYAVVSDGFRPPEITELYRLQRQQQVASLQSERLSAVEWGWRRSGSGWRSTLSLYAQQKRDVILRDANGFNVTGGRTTHQGVEYELSAALHPNWQLASSGSVARHRYAFTSNIDGGETIVNGRDIDTAPRQLHRASLRWQPTETLAASVEFAHVGTYFADAANQQRYPGHTVASLRLYWSIDQQWQLSLDIENLGNRLYADRADYAQGEWRYFPAPERSIFLTVQTRRGTP